MRWLLTKQREPSGISGQAVALLCAGLGLSCGGSTSKVDEIAEPPAAQDLVPPQLQKPGQARYFFAGGGATGPSMVVFEEPSAPRVVSLTHPEGRYRVGIREWSPGGTRFAYQLFSEELGIQTYRFQLSDAARAFTPEALEHEGLRERAYFIEWISERAIAVQTGVYHDAPDTYGWTGRYLWIDVEQGSVTELGELPPVSLDADTFGVLPAQPASTAHLWASPFGVAYLDGECGLVYLEHPAQKQTLLRDCSAVASFSGDGSFLLATTSASRRLFQRVDGRLEPASSAPALPATGEWSWAPHAPRFVLFEKTAGSGAQSVLSSLAVGDANAGTLVWVENLPRVNHASLVTDDLVVARDWGTENQPRRTFVSSAAGLGDPPELAPIEAGASVSVMPVVSHDSNRLYFPENPLFEVALDSAKPSQATLLFDEANPVSSVLFRLLDAGQTGLLTTVEPERLAPGGDPLSAFGRNRQYLLDLGHPGSVVPLGTFDVVLRSGAVGLRTFVSAPELGGIFYLGDGERGGFIDWLGFDDLTSKVRLLEAPGCCQIDVPPALSAVDDPR